MEIWKWQEDNHCEQSIPYSSWNNIYYYIIFIIYNNKYHNIYDHTERHTEHVEQHQWTPAQPQQDCPSINSPVQGAACSKPLQLAEQANALQRTPLQTYFGWIKMRILSLSLEAKHWNKKMHFFPHRDLNPGLIILHIFHFN